MSLMADCTCKDQLGNWFRGHLSNFLADCSSETPTIQDYFFHLKNFKKFEYIASPVSKSSTFSVIWWFSKSSLINDNDPIAQIFQCIHRVIPPLEGTEIAMNEEDGFLFLGFCINISIVNFLSIGKSHETVLHLTLKIYITIISNINSLAIIFMILMLITNLIDKKSISFVFSTILFRITKRLYHKILPELSSKENPRITKPFFANFFLKVQPF